MKTIRDFLWLFSATVLGALLGTAAVAILISAISWIVILLRPDEFQDFSGMFVSAASVIPLGTIFGGVLGWNKGTKWNNEIKKGDIQLFDSGTSQDQTSTGKK